MPFAVIAKILAFPLFFLPSAYILIMQLMQVAMVLIIAVLLLRMANIKNNIYRIMFLLAYIVSYPVLLFSIIVEQYIPSTFAAVFTIYFCVYRKKQNIAILALSCGVILTNAAIVPFATYTNKFLNWIKEMFKVILIFLTLCIFCGKVPTLIIAIDTVKILLPFANIGMSSNSNINYDKLQQFTHFIANCFIAPNTVEYTNIEVPVFRQAAPTTLSFTGVALFTMAATSVFINRKRFIAKTYGLWGLLAIIILYVIGWGSPENGMVLCTLYFGWAFFVLIFILIERSLSKYKVIKPFIFIAGILTLLLINMSGIFDLIRFGMIYYPTG